MRFAIVFVRFSLIVSGGGSPGAHESAQERADRQLAQGEKLVAVQQLGHPVLIEALRTYLRLGVKQKAMRAAQLLLDESERANFELEVGLDLLKAVNELRMPASDVARVHLSLAGRYFDPKRDYKTAFAHIDRAAVLLSEAPNSRLLARVHLERARIFSFRGEANRELHELQQALPRLQTVKDTMREARARGRIGVIRFEQGHIEEGLDNLESASKQATAAKPRVTTLPEWMEDRPHGRNAARVSG